MCGRGRFRSKSGLDAHRRKNHKHNMSCDICSKKRLRSPTALAQHQYEKHNIPPPYGCERCDEPCISKRTPEWHKQIHHGFVRYPIYEVEGECEGVGPSIPVCLDYPIPSRVSILVHPFFDHTCQRHDCDKSCENSEERRQHEISVHNRCLDCTGYFSSAAELKEHQSKTELILGEERTPKELARLEKFIRQKEKEGVSVESTSSKIPEERPEISPRTKSQRLNRILEKLQRIITRVA